MRGRIDWKYALGLQLADPGFDFSVLSEFRDRLIAHGLEQQILDAILTQCNKRGLLRAGGRACTDSTHVIACIRDLNRLEFVTETMRCALEALAVAAPAWLAGTDAVNANWLARYRQRADSYRLPKGEAERTAFAENVGATATNSSPPSTIPRPPPTSPASKQSCTCAVWAQEYQRDARGVRWRGHKQRPPGAARIVSPHDVDARCGVKRGSAWDGYKTPSHRKLRRRPPPPDHVHRHHTGHHGRPPAHRRRPSDLDRARPEAGPNTTWTAATPA